MTTGVRARWLVATCSVVAVLHGPAASYADDGDNTTPTEAAEAIADAAPAVLADAADVPTTSTGSTAIDATVAGTDVVVPTDPAAGIVVDPAAGPAVTIGLPSAQVADNAKPVTDGAVMYDNNNGSATVPVVKSDGSVQINTTIANADAPTTYRYPITVPEGGSLRLNADGSVSVLDLAGEFTSGFGVPWAKDAAGQPVATRYELEGNTLVQVVEHRVEGVQHPVVADPWFGMRLISSVRWSGDRLFVYPTVFGRVAPDMARGAAWNEVIARAPRANRSNMRDQFFCHWDVPFVRYKPSWNLEGWRPNVGYWSTVRQGCNPK